MDNQKDSEYKDHAGDTRLLLFVEKLNMQLSEEINHLRDEIRFLREVNMKLIDKLIGVTRINRNEISEEPIGGYVSLRSRISDAEETSRKEAESKDAS